MRPKRDILDEVIQAAGEGHREIQLLGQIVNHYQAPDDPSCDFAALLEAVHEVAGRRAHPVCEPASAARADAPGRGGARSAEGLQAFPSAGAVGIDARARRHAPALHARELSRAGRDASRHGARHRADDRHDRGVPGRDRRRFRRHDEPDASRPLREHVLVQVLAAAEYAGAEAVSGRRRRTRTRRGESSRCRRCSATFRSRCTRPKSARAWRCWSIR